MRFQCRDFNGVERVLDGPASELWGELSDVFGKLPLCLQPSDQARRIGRPIFDPKATNAFLTQEARALGWATIPVPPSLAGFGNDWDSGKGQVLAEWQFSNYPFLWNNVTRSETVFKSRTVLAGLQPIDALVIVTKSGVLPASNSTLYYEQACAQLDRVIADNIFSIPIRVVGLTVDPVDQITASWTTYSGRHARRGGVTEQLEFRIVRGSPGWHGGAPISFVAT